MWFTVVATRGRRSRFRPGIRVAPTANTLRPVPSLDVSWVWWLSGPVVATVLAALWAWLRGRPEPQPTTTEAMDEHREYLDALTRAPKHSSDGTQSSPR